MSDQQSTTERAITRLSRFAALLIVGLLVPPLPEPVWQIGLGVFGAAYLAYVGREFWNGIADAGGWGNAPRSNPDAP